VRVDQADFARNAVRQIKRPGSPEQFAAFVAREASVWAEMVRESGAASARAAEALAGVKACSNRHRHGRTFPAMSAPAVLPADTLLALLRPQRLTAVVDVGANPIDGDAPLQADAQPAALHGHRVRAPA
jgi:hypothetical protein